MAGEVKGLRQAGIGRAVYKNRGLSLEKMAERMHEAGYLPDEDPDTLINLLMHEGKTTFAGNRDTAFAAMADHAAGGVPGAETVPVPVTYQELKNLRSSIGNAAARIEAKAGKNPEWAALTDMRAEIDSRLNKVAAGKGDPGELFPPETVAAWRKANEAYSAAQDRFHRGPQAALFRAGGDANPSIQGAEIPPKFFNSGGSQIEDAQAFARLVGDNPELMGRLRSFATTQAAQQADRAGTLTAAKLGKWAANHSGAIENTFDPGQAAVLREIVKDVQRADSAATLGMAKGSNTAQNLQAAERAMASGLLDSRAVDLLAHKIPLVRDFTAPVLDALRKGSKGSKAQKLGGLLSDPEELATLLEEMRRPGLLGQISRPAVPLLYRGAPALSTSQ
jgi:hypothetical protein